MRLWIKYFVLGAICFWVPGVILAIVLRGEFTLVDLGLFTVLPVISVFSAYFLTIRSMNLAATTPSLAACMLLGIHVLGGWFLTFGYSFIGGGFHRFSPQDLRFLPLLFVPPVMWLLAGPSMFALFVVTLLLIFAHFRWERGRWVPFYSWHQKTKLRAPSS